jgi:hypothetical protein
MWVPPHACFGQPSEILFRRSGAAVLVYRERKTASFYFLGNPLGNLTFRSGFAYRRRK